jgi:hypothetical protein
MGIPDQPIRAARRPAGTAPVGGDAAAASGQGGIPSAPAGGPRQPPARVTIENAASSTATVIPNVAGIAHVILAVEDDGTPSLTTYRRIIVRAK